MSHLNYYTSQTKAPEYYVKPNEQTTKIRKNSIPLTKTSESLNPEDKKRRMSSCSEEEIQLEQCATENNQNFRHFSMKPLGCGNQMNTYSSCLREKGGL